MTRPLTRAQKARRQQRQGIQVHWLPAEVRPVVSGVADMLDPKPSKYQGKPVQWTREKLREHVTRDQATIMNSVVVNRYTAVQSCHDIGKSFSASRLVGWWLDSHPAGEAFVITTAPTAPQVSNILWREVGKAHRKGQLFGRITGDNQWKLDWGKPARRRKWGTKDDHEDTASEVVAIGRKPADYDPAAFQGYHARYILIIIDEACGVPKLLYDAIDSLATNKNARVLAIGNPDDPSSHFAKICEPGSGWHIIRIDALRSAGFTAERVAPYPKVVELMAKENIAPTDERVPEDLYDLLVDPEWVEERIKRWGIDSPLFASKVRGRFPIVSIDTLIHPHWVTLARVRDVEPAPMAARLGVDVARYGTDHTIILLRQGGHCRVAEDIPYGPTTLTTKQVMFHGRSLGVAVPTACVDDDGVGGGVVDLLEERGYPVVAVKGGAQSIQLLKNGKPRFFNRRAELFWNLREALAGASGTGEDGWLDLDPLDDEMAAQLTNIKYKVTDKGQIQVESKDQMAARGLPSPDRADALAYALCPDEPRYAARPLESNMITAGILTEKW